MNADEVEFIGSAGSGGNSAPTDADAPPDYSARGAAPVDPESGMTVVDPDDQPF